MENIKRIALELFKQMELKIQYSRDDGQALSKVAIFDIETGTIAFQQTQMLWKGKIYKGRDLDTSVQLKTYSEYQTSHSYGKFIRSIKN